MKTLTLEEWDAILEDEAELQKAKEFGYALYPKTRYGPSSKSRKAMTICECLSAEARAVTL